MTKLNKLLYSTILLLFAHSDLCSMKFIPLGQATFNLNAKIKKAQTTQEKINLIKTDEFKTLILRANRLTSADKNALPVIKFIKEELVPLAMTNADLQALTDLFTKLADNKLYPALLKEIKPMEVVNSIRKKL